MKKIKKIKGNCFYILQGRSNANSCFIEKLSHGALFLTYANSFLKNYLTVYDYIINQDGWMMVVKIKSKKELLSNKELQEGEVWRIVSERVRLFLSTYVRVSNRMKRRTGCLVHSSYERFYFETLGEAIKIINGVRQQRIKLYNGRKKYRGKKTHYKVSKSIGKGSIFICSRDVQQLKAEASKFGEMLSGYEMTEIVLEEILKFTLSSHDSSFSTKNHSNSPSQKKDSS